MWFLQCGTQCGTQCVTTANDLLPLMVKNLMSIENPSDHQGKLFVHQLISVEVWGTSGTRSHSLWRMWQIFTTDGGIHGVPYHQKIPCSCKNDWTWWWWWWWWWWWMMLVDSYELSHLGKHSVEDRRNFNDFNQLGPKSPACGPWPKTLIIVTSVTLTHNSWQYVGLSWRSAIYWLYNIYI